MIFSGILINTDFNTNRKRDGKYSLTVEKVRSSDGTSMDGITARFEQRLEKGRYKLFAGGDVRQCSVSRTASKSSFNGDLTLDADAAAIDNLVTLAQLEELSQARWKDLVLNGLGIRATLNGKGGFGEVVIVSTLLIPAAGADRRISLEKDLAASLTVRSSGIVTQVICDSLNHYLGKPKEEAPPKLDLRIDVARAALSVNHQRVANQDLGGFLRYLDRQFDN
jgi:hypothetical protein